MTGVHCVVLSLRASVTVNSSVSSVSGVRRGGRDRACARDRGARRSPVLTELPHSGPWSSGKPQENSGCRGTHSGEALRETLFLLRVIAAAGKVLCPERGGRHRSQG